jgi:hypothetical protein
MEAIPSFSAAVSGGAINSLIWSDIASGFSHCSRYNADGNRPFMDKKRSLFADFAE